MVGWLDGWWAVHYPIHQIISDLVSSRKDLEIPNEKPETGKLPLLSSSILLFSQVLEFRPQPPLDQDPSQRCLEMFFSFSVFLLLPLQYSPHFTIPSMKWFQNYFACKTMVLSSQQQLILDGIHKKESQSQSRWSKRTRSKDEHHHRVHFVVIVIIVVLLYNLNFYLDSNFVYIHSCIVDCRLWIVLCIYH